MYSFKNDYSEIAHPEIIKYMMKLGLEKNIGYGEDEHSKKAKEYIKNHLKRDDVDIHFIPGGTQTNLLAIASMLRPYQAVISADTGHINLHETGAIEATGHKILTIKNKNGKIDTKGIKEILDLHTGENMVMPKMVYISNSTELGTIYNKNELTSISQFCRDNNLILFMDGARLGSALVSKENDLTLYEISDLVDAFYIGGTKNGALFGEAFIIVNDKYKKDFRYMIKQRGAMLAKGFITGIQFEVLFKDDLFFQLASAANHMAELLSSVIKKHGYELYVENYTNQVFSVLPNEIIEKMSNEFLFEEEKKLDKNRTAIRFVTSWATDEPSIKALDDFLENC